MKYVSNMLTSGGGNLVQHRYIDKNDLRLNKRKEFSIYNTRFLYAFLMGGNHE